MAASPLRLKKSVKPVPLRTQNNVLELLKIQPKQLKKVPKLRTAKVKPTVVLEFCPSLLRI